MPLPRPLLGLQPPLNVYAYCVWRAYGGLDYLHYGLFDDPSDDDLPAAQWRATEWLWPHLPPPCRVLEVGIGVGTTAERLLAQGYTYAGVTPDPAQVAWVRNRLGIVPELHVSLFEELPPERRYDLVLFQESAQYMPPDVLLRQCDRLLADAGRIVIVDEVSREVAEGLQVGRRQGPFEVVTREDVTARAIPSARLLRGLVERFHDDVVRELRIPAESMAGLLGDLRRREVEYDTGAYRYLGVVLQRARA